MSTVVRTYVARPHSHLSDKEAGVVGEFLDRKLGVEGPRKAEDYVRLATPVRSPIHDTLTWDDTTAAHEFRLHEARRIIGALKVENGDGRTTRAFHNVVLVSEQGERERVYMPSFVVWQSPDLAEQVKEKVRRTLSNTAELCEEYDDLSETLGHIERAMETLA